MGHVRAGSVRVRERLELIARLVGVHLFAEAEQVERGVRADLVVDSCESRPKQKSDVNQNLVECELKEAPRKHRVTRPHRKASLSGFRARTRDEDDQHEEEEEG